MSELKIFTSSYYSYFGPGRIGISRGTPRGLSAGYKMYRALAPDRDMLKMPLAPYRERYFDMLSKLDPDQVLEDLKEKANGSDVAVLLCFERPPFTETNFCHRHMVAEWLKDERGIVVPEWSGVGDTNSEQLPLGA